MMYQAFCKVLLCHKHAHTVPYTVCAYLKNHPKIDHLWNIVSKTDFRSIFDPPRHLQGTSKTPQDASKTSPRRSKTVPKTLQDGSKALREASKAILKQFLSNP